jgi:hypothetical protein
MTRQNRTKQDLQDASQHLRYEIEMFNAMADLLSGGTYKNTVVENALLESFTVHARALAEFFDPPLKRRDDDMIAEHYVTGWSAKRGALPPVLDKVRVKDRVGKEIAHLTYARLTVTPAAKGWNITEITQAMNSLIQKFSVFAPADCLASPWPVPQPSSKPELMFTTSTTTPMVLGPTVTVPSTVVSSPSATKRSDP